MIEIDTNHNIKSTGDKFNEIYQMNITIKNIERQSIKEMIKRFVKNEVNPLYQIEFQEGESSLKIELSFEKEFVVSFQNFESIVLYGSTSEQRKDLKKISKTFQKEFKRMETLREKRMVETIYKMYVKELKKGNIEKTRRDFKRFLRNCMEN